MSNSDLDFLDPVSQATEVLLTNNVLGNLKRIPGYAPGIYEVRTEDGKWTRRVYALCEMRARAYAHLDYGDGGRAKMLARLVEPDPNAAPVEDVLE